MNSSKNYFATDRTFMTMIVLALLAGFVFFATNSLDFLIAANSRDKFSIANTAYILIKTLSTVALPLIFIVPSIKPLGRIKALKVMFFIIGALHILSLSWLVNFVMENGFAAIFSDDLLTAFQKPENNAIVPGIILWDTYSWIGCLFTIIFSAICIWAGICFDDTKGRVCTAMTVLTIFRIFAPLILDLTMKGQFLSGMWLTNNYVDIVCWFLMTLAVFTAARYDETWIVLIWDQEIPQDEDEEQ